MLHDSQLKPENAPERMSSTSLFNNDECPKIMYSVSDSATFIVTYCYVIKFLIQRRDLEILESGSFFQIYVDAKFTSSLER